jgi:hypothetical protein
MRRYVFRLAVLTLVAFTSSAARADDQQIAQQIVERLQTEKQAGGLKGFSIDLQVDEGTVWLSGRVANSAQQAKALDIARRIPGVVQVVNDLIITAPATATPIPVVATPSPTPASNLPVSNPYASTNMLGNTSNALVNASTQRQPSVQPTVAAQDVAGTSARTAIGSGVKEKSSSQSSLVQSAQPVANVPQTLAIALGPQAAAAQPIATADASPFGPQAAMNGMPYGAVAVPYPVPVPVYAGSRSQVPLAFAPARPVSYQGSPETMSGAPVPMYMPGSGVGIAPARYDHPTMPGYAWPSYAAYPNYAAVTAPKQYSPTAWPYIGPFYPYPQVPLGWRKVTLEWDDGWWVLDFKDRRTMYNHK